MTTLAYEKEQLATLRMKRTPPPPWLPAFWKEIDDKTFGKGFDCFSTVRLAISAPERLSREQTSKARGIGANGSPVRGRRRGAANADHFTSCGTSRGRPDANQPSKPSTKILMSFELSRSRMLAAVVARNPSRQ